MIATAQSTSNNIDRDTVITASTMQQSFCIVVSQKATTITDKCEGRIKQLPCNNHIFMLLFTGCNDNHIAPGYAQQHKYVKV
jgi:hypothetical protein